MYQVLSPSRKYFLSSIISIKSPNRSPKSKRISPRCKTVNTNNNTTTKKGRVKLLKGKSKTLNEVQERKLNLIEKTLHNQAVVEKLDQFNNLSKSLSHEYSGEQVSLSMPSSGRSNRDEYNDLQGDDDKDFVDERVLEFLKFNKYFLTIQKPCKNYKEFQKEKIEKLMKETYLIYGCLLIFYTLESVIDFMLNKSGMNDTYSARGIPKFILDILLFFLSFIGIDKLFRFLCIRVVFVTFILAIFVLQILDLHYENDRIMKDIDFALMFCPIIFLTNFSFFTFLEIFIINVTFFIILLVVIVYSQSITLENILMTILILIHNIIKIFFQLRHQIKVFNNFKSARIKRLEQEEQISQLLPVHVIKKAFYLNCLCFHF